MKLSECKPGSVVLVKGQGYPVIVGPIYDDEPMIICACVILRKDEVVGTGTCSFPSDVDVTLLR